MQTWNFAGIPAKLRAADGTVVEGRLEKVELVQENILGTPVAPLTAVVTLRAARGFMPPRKLRTPTEPRDIALDGEAIKHLMALHSSGALQLQQIKAMMWDPVLGSGAKIMYEELGPALVWLAGILRKEGV